MSTDDDKGLELVIDDRDRYTELWQKLQAHLVARLDMLRRKNDATNLTPEQTAVLRGQIAELKKLLAAGVSQD